MNTLFVSAGTNSVHEKMAEHIGADIHHIKSRVTKEQGKLDKLNNLLNSIADIDTDYDIILCENNYYYSALKRILVWKKPKIINMACGGLFYNLSAGVIKGLERKVLLSLAQEIDGHLLLGHYGVELMERLGLTQPHKIVYPFVPDKQAKKLLDMETDLDSKEMTIIARGDPHYKGLDMLLKAYYVVSRKQDVMLNIISRDIPPSWIWNEVDKNKIDTKKVRYHHNPPEIDSILKRTALYVQPSRGDTFPVASIEAMMAGIPTIVSSETGTKEIANDCFKDTNGMIRLMAQYLNMSDKDRRLRSDVAKAESMKFVESEMLPFFKNNFELLVKAIR